MTHAGQKVFQWLEIGNEDKAQSRALSNSCCNRLNMATITMFKQFLRDWKEQTFNEKEGYPKMISKVTSVRFLSHLGTALSQFGMIDDLIYLICEYFSPKSDLHDEMRWALAQPNVKKNDAAKRPRYC
jgi:hypothetical protein